MNEHITELPTFRGHAVTQPLYRLLNGRGFIGGSYAGWTVSPYPKQFVPNDIDIFMRSEADALSFREELRGEGYWLRQESAIAFTMTHYEKKKKDIQIIKPSPEWSSFPGDVIESFDLDVCRAILIKPRLCLADYNAGSLCGKVLRVNNPLRTLKRILKYQQRGVGFNDHELLKVFQAWEAASDERKQNWLEEAADALSTFDANSDGWDYTPDDWWDGE
jgi:hypothetical protein